MSCLEKTIHLTQVMEMKPIFLFARAKCTRTCVWVALCALHCRQTNRFHWMRFISPVLCKSLDWYCFSNFYGEKEEKNLLMFKFIAGRFFLRVMEHERFFLHWACVCVCFLIQFFCCLLWFHMQSLPFVYHAWCVLICHHDFQLRYPNSLQCSVWLFLIDFAYKPHFYDGNRR